MISNKIKMVKIIKIKKIINNSKLKILVMVIKRNLKTVSINPIRISFILIIFLEKLMDILSTCL